MRYRDALRALLSAANGRADSGNGKQTISPERPHHGQTRRLLAAHLLVLR